MFELDLDGCVLDSVFFPHQAARFRQRGFSIFVRSQHKMAAHGGHFRCDCPYVQIMNGSNSFHLPQVVQYVRDFQVPRRPFQKNVNALGNQFP